MTMHAAVIRKHVLPDEIVANCARSWPRSASFTGRSTAPHSAGEYVFLEVIRLASGCSSGANRSADRGGLAEYLRRSDTIGDS